MHHEGDRREIGQPIAQEKEAMNIPCGAPTDIDANTGGIYWQTASD